MRKFPPREGQQYIVEMPTGVLDSVTREKIRDLCSKEGYPIPSDDSLPEDFWEWATKRGTFPKRLAKWLKGEHGIKVSSDFLGKVGDIAGSCANHKSQYRYDVNWLLDWQDGEFGDAGSCFWGGRSGARSMLRENGAFAFRLYDESGNGYARCWVWEAKDWAEEEKQGPFVVFNGYGETTLRFARIISVVAGGTYKKINIANMGSYEGELWINGGGTGYVVGSSKQVDNFPDYFDFEWEEYSVGCYVCGTPIEVDSDDCHRYDYEYYCTDCFYRHFMVCERCGYIMTHDNVCLTPSEIALCIRCFYEKYSYCEFCGGALEIAEAVEVPSTGGYAHQECVKEDSDEEEVA